LERNSAFLPRQLTIQLRMHQMVILAWWFLDYAICLASGVRYLVCHLTFNRFIAEINLPADLYEHQPLWGCGNQDLHYPVSTPECVLQSLIQLFPDVFDLGTCPFTGPAGWRHTMLCCPSLWSCTFSPWPLPFRTLCFSWWQICWSPRVSC
jgi:hypothetical protein